MSGVGPGAGANQQSIQPRITLESHHPPSTPRSDVPGFNVAKAVVAERRLDPFPLERQVVVVAEDGATTRA